MDDVGACWVWATRLTRREAAAALVFDYGGEDRLPANDFLRSTGWRETYDEELAELVPLGDDPARSLGRATIEPGSPIDLAAAIAVALPDATSALLVFDESDAHDDRSHESSPVPPRPVPPGCPWRFVGVFDRDGRALG